VGAALGPLHLPALGARTRWSCNPASVRLPSASVRPIVPAEHSIGLAPPARTSCNRTVPSLPINSKMTGHFIGLPRSGVISLAHTAPGLRRSHASNPGVSCVLTPLHGCHPIIRMTICADVRSRAAVPATSFWLVCTVANLVVEVAGLTFIPQAEERVMSAPAAEISEEMAFLWGHSAYEATKADSLTRSSSGASTATLYQG
jgi:hypothetical protein